MWTLTFWRAVVERALKTAAQTAVATIGTTAAFNAVDWPLIGSVVLLATVLSVLTSIASAASTDGSPSLNGSEIVTPPMAIVTPLEPPSTTAIDGKAIHNSGDGGEPTTSTL